jgi:hypothetical protein
MNDGQVLAVFGTFVLGAIIIALIVLYLDSRDRRDKLRHARHPAE